MKLEIDEKVLRTLTGIYRECSQKRAEGQKQRDLAAAEVDLARAAQVRWEIEKEKNEVAKLLLDLQQLENKQRMNQTIIENYEVQTRELLVKLDKLVELDKLKAK